jgi:hypothetical protein
VGVAGGQEAHRQVAWPVLHHQGVVVVVLLRDG